MTSGDTIGCRLALAREEGGIRESGIGNQETEVRSTQRASARKDSRRKSRSADRGVFREARIQNKESGQTLRR
jgi:hypothetical protein